MIDTYVAFADMRKENDFILLITFSKMTGVKTIVQRNFINSCDILGFYLEGVAGGFEHTGQLPGFRISACKKLLQSFVIIHEARQRNQAFRKNPNMNTQIPVEKWAERSFCTKASVFKETPRWYCRYPLSRGFTS